MVSGDGTKRDVDAEIAEMIDRMRADASNALLPVVDAHPEWKGTLTPYGYERLAEIAARAGERITAADTAHHNALEVGDVLIECVRSGILDAKPVVRARAHVDVGHDGAFVEFEIEVHRRR